MTADETSERDNNSKPDSGNNDVRNSFDNIRNEILNTKITFDKIRKVIADFKNSKAAVLDKIILELIEDLHENTQEIFVLLLNKISDNGVFPEE